ncbi:MAG: HEAT repeat domain-containing protein [Acidimicrobiia bacterium]|nr:HEAT repeat domain-containing protein [Acidimicrobiia bacterium]
MNHGSLDAPQRRRAAAIAGFCGDTDRVIALWHDTDPKVRIAAMRALAKLEATQQVSCEFVEQALEDALADGDPRVRIAALEVASRYSQPPLEPMLSDDDPMVVECAAWALGERQVDSKTIIARLSEVVREHADPLVRESAVAALGAIGDRRGLPALLQATRDKVTVRRRAVIALAAFEGPEVEAAYERARFDRDRQVRDAVEELLGPTQ